MPINQSTQENFEAAVAASTQLKEKPSNEILLKLYSLYKQATEGDAPAKGDYGMFDFVGKAKHEAWLSLKGMELEDARAAYIALVTQLG